MDDLVNIHQIRFPPQVEAARTLRESTEPAAEIAQVRVVDVAIDDVGDVITDRPAAQFIRHPGYRVDLISARLEQRLNLTAARRRSFERAFQDRRQVPGNLKTCRRR